MPTYVLTAACCCKLFQNGVFMEPLERFSAFLFFMLSCEELHAAGALYVKSLVLFVLSQVIGNFSLFLLFDVSTLQLS